MNSQVPFNLSQVIGQAVDVTSYATYQHPVCSSIGTLNTINNHGSVSQGTGSQSLTVQNVEMTSGSGMVALGYAQHQQTTPMQSYHAVFNGMTLTPIPSHVQTPQVQYFSYETPCVTLKPAVVSQHVQPIQPIGTQAPEYDICPVTYQEVKPSESHNDPVAPQPTNMINDPIAEMDKVPCEPEKKSESVNAKHHRKLCRNRGEAYVSVSGKQIEAKQYRDKDCACKRKCLSKLGSVHNREEIFKQFWNIGDFSQQNAYINDNVTLAPTEGKKRRISTSDLDEKNLKTVKRLYHVKLMNADVKVRVCKTMFLSLHGVSNGRLDRVLQAVNCSVSHALQDRRGHHTPSNKTKEDDVRFAVEHISTVRQSGEAGQSSECESVEGVSPSQPAPQVAANRGKETSVKEIYSSYKRVCKENGRTPVSLWVFRRIEKVNFTQENVPERVPNPSLLDDRMSAMQVPFDNNESRILTANDMNVCNTSEIIVKNSAPDLELNLGNNQMLLSHTKTLDPCKSPMSREERKAKRNSGSSYLTATGKLKDQKYYVDKECGCRYRCIPELGSFEIRQKVFCDFWKLADFSRQNAYIAKKVHLAPVAQKNSGKRTEKFAKTCSRLYYVPLKNGEDDVRVCKAAFLHLHGVSNGRVGRVLQAVACKSPYALQDRRGHHSPKNKTRDEDIEYVSSHIRSFLEERPENNARGLSEFCIPLDFNIKKMYRLYREMCLQSGRAPVGCFVYRKVLRQRFNCHIRSPANKTLEEDLDYAYQHISECLGNVTELGRRVTQGLQQPTHPNPPRDSSVRKFHSDYIEKCIQEGRKPVGIDVYRKIFNSKSELDGQS